jgi:spermidine/putrescine transport system substrate-binding protein
MTPIDRRGFLRRSAVAAMAAASLPTILTGCDGDEEPATTSGGSSSTAALALTGTLNFLNFEGWIGAGEISAFEKLYPGAKVNVVPWQSNDDTIAKAKDRVGDIDVLLVDGTTFPQLEALGVLAELGPTVANLANIDAAYRANVWDPDDRYFAATDYGRTGIAYRRDLVEGDAPTSFADFFDLARANSGKTIVLDYQRSVMGSMMKMLGFPPSSADQGHIDAVQARLIELKPHLLAISTEVGKQLASGDAVLALADAYDVYTAKQENDSIEWVDPSDGQVAYLEGLAILDGPRNDLARAFVDFHLRKDQYADFINTVNSAGVMPDNEAIDEDLRTTPILNPNAEVRSRIDFHEFLGESGEAWQIAWDAFKSA